MRCTTSSATSGATPASCKRPPPDGMSEPRSQRDDQFQRPGDAEKDADAAAVERLAGAVRPHGVAGVFEGLLRGDESEKLRRVGGFEVAGGDAVGGGVEIDGIEEAAARGVDAVGRLGVGVEVVFGPPVGGRHVGDAIDAVLDVGPVRAEAVGLGEEAADADDRQRGGRCGWSSAFKPVSSLAGARLSVYARPRGERFPGAAAEDWFTGNVRPHLQASRSRAEADDCERSAIRLIDPWSCYHWQARDTSPHLPQHHK